MTENLLAPLQKLPRSKVVTILLVGDQGTGKHQLAKALVETDTTFSLEVRTATSLPLPPDTTGSRPRIDFVVFIVDLTNKKSLTVAGESAAQMDVNMFLGKCCFVATNVSDGEKQIVDMGDVTQLATAYHSHLFCTNLKDDTSRRVVAGQIVKMAATSGGLHSAVSSLLVCATHRPTQAYVL